MIDLSSVDVEDLLMRLEIQNARMTAGGIEINFSCFTGQHSHGDESPSAYINSETTAWMCHGCHAHGNAITLVMEVQQVERPVAERVLREWYGIEFDEPLGGSMVAEIAARLRPPEPRVERVPPPRSWLSSVRFDWAGGEVREPQHEYMLSRGFTPSTLAEWDLGYDYLSDRITIPVFDVDGELVGAKGRDWTGERKPKYQILGDQMGRAYGFSPYETSEVVFGLHRRRDVKTVVACEGELNAIALEQLGVPRPVGIGMSYMSDRQAQLLVREAEEVVLYMDHGEAGSIAVWGRTDNNDRYHPGAVSKLEGHVRVRVVDPPPEDPADMLKLGRGHEALLMIEQASSTLALATAFR